MHRSVSTDHGRLTLITDQYDLLMELPKAVSPALAPYASQVLSTLISEHAFHILPVSGLEPYNPRTLPREVYVEDEELSEMELDHPMSGKRVPKKKGRPSKRDMAKKTKDAVVGLGRWLERTEPVGQAGPSRAWGHAQTVSRASYRVQKGRVVSALLEGEGVEALERANMAVLGRLKKIDAMAAEKGMEVGGEGGESTGLGRVERAVGELAEGKPGILGLIDGAGK